MIAEFVPSEVAAASPASAGEKALLEALRNRDECAFARLVNRGQSSLARVAMLYVQNPHVAAEVVQEA